MWKTDFPWSPRRGLRVALLLGLTAIFCGGTGTLLRPADSAHAEVRRATSPQHFQSGAALSHTTLLEIAATLKRMDERLARLEKLAQGAAAATQAARQERQ